MSVWDEVPGGGAPSGGPSNSAIPPQLQALMKLFSMAKPGMPQQPQQPQQQGGIVSPGIVGQVPQPGGVPGQGGPAPAMMPGATEGGPSKYAVAPPPINTDTAFQNKGARASAITSNIMSGLSSAFQSYKQKEHDKKTQAAKASMMEQMMQQMDPASQKQLQKLAQSDPKIAKALEKKQKDFMKMYEKAMTDPNSPEYYGFQQAYKELQAQQQYAQQMEETKAKIAEAYANQQKAEAEAALARKKESIEGQVTPASTQKATTEIEKQKIATQGIVDRYKEQTAAFDRRTEAMLKIANERTKYLKAALGQKTGDKTLDSLAKEYTNIKSQITNLNSQSKSLQDDLSKGNIVSNWWTGKGKEVHQKLQGIEAQRSALEKQLQAIEQKRQVMLQVGVIPPANDGVDAPITVSPEDMQTVPTSE